jgi:hypothetical protein
MRINRLPEPELLTRDLHNDVVQVPNVVKTDLGWGVGKTCGLCGCSLVGAG